MVRTVVPKGACGLIRSGDTNRGCGERLVGQLRRFRCTINVPPEVIFTVAFQETVALTQLYSLSDYPVLAQRLFHWSRLSEIHTEPLVARYTVAGVPVVIHVLAPQVQVDVPVVAVVKDLLEQVDLPEVLVVHVPGAGRCPRCDGCAGFSGMLWRESALTIADRCEICTCPVRRALSCVSSAAVDLGTLRRYHSRATGGLRAGQFRSGRIAIPCGGWARSFTGMFVPVAGGRDASAIPSVWFDVCPVVGRVFHM